jgi:hypothetical protein
MFLNVTDQVEIMIDSKRQSQRQEDVLKITNTSSSVVDTHLLVITKGLSDQIQLENSDEMTSDGERFLRVFLDDGVLLPDQSIMATLKFRRKDNASPVSYTPVLLSGQGTP